MAVEPIEWRGVVLVQYGTVTLADAAGAARGLIDPDGFHRVFEQHCGSLGEGVQILLPERDDDVPAHVRVVDALGEVEPDWDHVAELGFRVPTGRLIVFSWMPDEEVVGELTVPTEPLLARIHWGGLEAWLTDSSYRSTGGPSPLHLRIDLVPGELAGVRTLRTWHLWAPPTHESTSPAGLRRYRGLVAAERQASLVPDVVDLPAGWSRITRRNPDGTGPAVLGDKVPGDGADGVYVRWRDGSDVSV